MTPAADPGVPAVAKKTFERVWSPQLRNRRSVDVYLPPSYAAGRRRFPVVYMQDGQNLSDPNTAFAGTWQLDAAIDDLARRGIEAIVVGVHNMGAGRLGEYSPFPDRKHGGGDAGKYLAFLTDTLKPRIDRLFRTVRVPARTATVGSSMGGLFSLYAFLRRADVFGLAGIMSPSLWFGRSRLFDYVESVRALRGRVYLDVGTAEGAGTLRDARTLKAMLERKGLRERESLMYVEDRGGRHEEASWSRRLTGVLEFLLQ
jgi:predicted alpha/beta superfamily hydrolase